MGFLSAQGSYNPNDALAVRRYIHRASVSLFCQVDDYADTVTARCMYAYLILFAPVLPSPLAVPDAFLVWLFCTDPKSASVIRPACFVGHLISAAIVYAHLQRLLARFGRCQHEQRSRTGGCVGAWRIGCLFRYDKLAGGYGTGVVQPAKKEEREYGRDD